MAIDMIENNELSALAPSRLGLNQFVDDKKSNYTGAEDFYNLFGSRKEKKSSAKEQVKLKYGSLPTDCANIDSSISTLLTDIQSLSKEKSKLQNREALSEMENILKSFNEIKLTQKCDEIKAEESKSDVKKSGDGTKKSVASSNKNLLIYGGIGVVAIVVIALILKK